MVHNYIKTSVRSITKQMFYSVLNILGFSLGIALFIFISLFLYEQFSYDRWYKNHPQIYRVELGDWGILGPIYGRIIQDASADIEKTLRINNNWGSNAAVTAGDNENVIKIPHLILADSTVFDFFDFRFIHGSEEHALADNNNIVLTLSQASKLFGKSDAVGEVIRLYDRYNLTVSAVIEDISRFHLKVDAIGSFELFRDIFSPEYMESTGDWNHHTYVKVHPEADIADVSDNVKNVISQFINELFGVEFDRDVNLRPVADIYFTNTVAHEIMVLHGSKTTSYAFFAIAIFIMLIAIINFVNLSTARSAGRAREVGIRKLLGSDRKKLITQFLAESIILTTIAVIIAFALVELLLPWFNYMADSEISLQGFGFLNLLVIFLPGAIIIGIISGIYPAFYLSTFKPITTLRGETAKGTGAALFRKVLIVFQFTVSVALIAGTIIVFHQLNYMRSKDPGFNKENIVCFQTNAKVRQNWESFQNTLLANPTIVNVARTYNTPGNIHWQETIVENGEGKQFTFWPMTPEYFSMLGIELLAGRAFSREYTTDEETAVIVNEQWVRVMGFSDNYQELLNKAVSTNYHNFRIIGIVPDFHFNSLHQSIAPLMMVWRERSVSVANVKIHGNNISSALEHIRKTWAQYSPHEMIEYKFLEDSLEALYDRENRLGLVFTSFSAFAIIIACLGLFGLTSFMVEKRTKEIAIRKVLGASTQRLLYLFSKDFLTLVAISLIFAIPLGYYALDYWLNTFPYHIKMPAAPYIFAALTAIILTLLTVGFHVIKASQSNPAEPLKNE
jgi:putative ABC transport system permease protein